MSAMDVDAGVEEKKGEERAAPAAAMSAERTQKGKGEGDRNIMLHPVSRKSVKTLQSRLDTNVYQVLRVSFLLL